MTDPCAQHMLQRELEAAVRRTRDEPSDGEIRRRASCAWRRLAQRPQIVRGQLPSRETRMQRGKGLCQSRLECHRHVGRRELTIPMLRGEAGGGAEYANQQRVRIPLAL